MHDKLHIWKQLGYIVCAKLQEQEWYQELQEIMNKSYEW